LDSATPPFRSAQNDSILRGFLNPGSDVREATLKCFLLVILHEGHACLKLQDPLFQESSTLDSATLPFGSAQKDSILRGFLNPGFDVLEPTLKCFLLVILHEGHSCLKLQNPLYVKNPQHLDSATPPFGSAQNDSILRGFLNPGFDV
jgi:hypothetical protein